MSEGSKTRHRPSSVLTRKSLATSRGSLIEGGTSGQAYGRESTKSRKTTRVLSELPKNQIKQKPNSLKGIESRSNIDLSLGTNEAHLGGKIPSCENVSRIVKISKIPRATGGRKFGGESHVRLAKLNEVKKRAERPTEVNIAKENVGHFDDVPGTSNGSTESSVLTEGCKKLILSKSDSCESKQSSGDFFDDSLEPVSDDEIIDISGDITIRKEALDIAVKLASRTPTEIEESSALGFPELAMLDILGGSDLNLNVQKNELSFPIFEDMDNITDSVNRPEEVSLESSVPVASARSPSPMEEVPLSSRTPNAPVSIITSITSIMSLDTGYQGDGELSRPESRSAEVDSRPKMPNAESGVQVKSIQFDDSKTMTDSDFFTESDADIHDDLSAAAAEIGSGKGDRKAQVIDGTLYGGVIIHKNGLDGDNRSGVQDSINAPFSDDMASSGIFSDVEKKPDDSLRMEEDSPEATGHNSDGMQDNVSSEEDRKSRPEVSEGMVKSSSAESSSTIQEIAPTMVRTSSAASVQDSERSGQKPIKTAAAKNKMPNRNVASKVKVLIETSKTKPETVARPKTVRKGKWDAVMDRIAQGKEENKYTPTRFRDIKSKVYQSAKPMFNGKSDETDVSKSSTNSLQSKTRSRRNVRLRSSDSPLVSTKTSRKATSPNSSQRSSISDISVSAVNKQKLINDSNQNGIPAKSASTTVISSVTNTANNNNNNLANNKHKVKTIKMVQKKSSPLPPRSKDVVQQKNGGLHIRAEEKTVGLLKQLRHNCKAFESFAVLLSYCIEDLEAFSTPRLKLELQGERERYRETQSRLEEVEHHLQEQLVSKIRMINDLEKENRDLVEKTEEFTSVVENLKYEQNSLLEKLSSMEEELGARIREKEEMEEELKRENQELAYRVEESNKTYSVLKKMYDKVKTELTVAKEANARMDFRQRREVAVDCGGGRGDVPPDRLESEVESLRQVLALKTDEVSELRRQELFLRENADRVPKLVSTITLLEGKVEDFHMQLSSQIEANRELEKRNYNLEEELKLANVQKLRLTQKNEELQYKLKQYADALRQLVSQKNLTEDDIRNVYLYPKTPQKGDCSVIVDSLAAQMKGVVQKSDSVSYMLEMKEDSSEIVTNIIRRAESMRYASRSQTLPKKKRPKTYSVSSMDALSPFEDYIAGNGDKASSSSTKFPFPDVESPKTPKNKVVKLNPNDFVPDGIELAGVDSCEIIEITKNFDRAAGKADVLANEMSCSSCSSSSENGNQFDIESDVYSNARESDEGREAEKEPETDLRIGSASYSADESAEEVSGYPEDGDDGKCAFSDFGNVPKTSGGEALIVSSDDARSDSP